MLQNTYCQLYMETSKMNKYEDAITLIKRNLAYYETHAKSIYADPPPSVVHALGCVMALKEILDHFNEEYPGHKTKCGGDLGCMCGLSPFTVTKVETLAHYECKCGHKWTDDEYPLATYADCPSCKVKLHD